MCVVWVYGYVCGMCGVCFRYVCMCEHVHVRVLDGSFNEDSLEYWGELDQVGRLWKARMLSE